MDCFHQDGLAYEKPPPFILIFFCVLFPLSLLCIFPHLILDLPDCYLYIVFIFYSLKGILLPSMWNTYSCYLTLISPAFLFHLFSDLGYCSCFVFYCFFLTLHRNFIPIVCNLLESLLAHVYRSVLKQASDTLHITKLWPFLKFINYK
jgi:hypothetical protein